MGPNIALALKDKGCLSSVRYHFPGAGDSIRFYREDPLDDGDKLVALQLLLK